MKDPIITKKILDLFHLDIDGSATSAFPILNLFFYPNYPTIDIVRFCLYKIYGKELKGERDIYITVGFNITIDEEYIILSLKELRDFIVDNGTVHYCESTIKFSYFEMMGFTIFDDTCSWLLHNNPDVGNLSFSYDSRILNETIVSQLKENKWYLENGNKECIEFD